MIRSVLVLGCIALGWGVELVLAASLVSVDLSLDASTDPPGDVLTVTVAFAADQERLQVEVRAVRVSADQEDQLLAIESDVRETQDDQGLFLIRETIAKPVDHAVVSQRIVVPYRSLKLPLGSHRVGYELRGIDGQQEVFRTATRVTVFEVTELARQEIERTTIASAAVPQPRLVTAYVMQNGKLQEREVLLEVPRVVHSVKTERLPVDIPGSFHRSEIDEVARGEEEALQPTVMLAEFVPESKRQILFATNRNVALPGEASLIRFGDQLADETHYGVCRVNIPVARHVRGSLELPVHRWWKQDPERHFIVESLSVLTREQFLAEVSKQDMLLFVHGYATPLQIAILRTAQLQHDIEFPGRAITFAWPSRGRIESYPDDRKLALQSVDALADLLESIVQQQVDSGGSLHLIAHSMGNEVLLRAIAKLESEQRIRPATKPFGGVVLAAADVSPATFEACLPAVLKFSRDIAYYYSLQDVALEISAKFNGTPRVGLHPMMVPGVDTINADNVNSRFYYCLGHTYYASSDPVLTDLRLYLSYRLQPAARQPPLGQRIQIAGLSHWSFLSDAVLRQNPLPE